MAKPKKAKLSPGRSYEKRVRIPPETADQRHPLWSFRTFDNTGDWCWSTISISDAMSIMQRLKDYESMTWASIKRASHCHYIEPFSIIPEAQERLRKLKRFQTNALFSMSVGSKPRLWGILEDHVAFLLWWDPKHEIYPSRPK